ncbi:endo-1,4-beta-xylanase [Halomicrobium salinisoli]|uniref:endo-1,4-beta-xylanase n=1 Tax=Halomicrobium salinisoli TaxID=2878391 RepID=UPI001CEFB95A|nr:endo-1,4-beta-xylanase [Halomicrobium salinisoli]
MEEGNSRSHEELDSKRDLSVDRRGYLRSVGVLGALGVGASASASTAAAQDGSDLIDYDGRAEDAEWREAADERIDEIRKTDVEVEVRNPGGNPMNDATVDVEMVDHAFDFGSAVSVSHVLGDSEDDEIYRETFLDTFNKAVIENGLKFPSFEGPWGDSKAGAKAALDWLNDNDIPTRGHYLLWEGGDTSTGGGMAIPNADELSDEEVHQRVNERIADHASDIGDQVTEWDMHNHPIWQSQFRDRENIGWGGENDFRDWWDTADENTDAELYTNEMGNVAGDFFRDAHYGFVNGLVQSGAPIDGVGFMGHVQQPNGNVTPPKEMLETYDQYSDLGLPILITEFDIQIESRDDETLVEWQTDFLRDFLTASFSHESVEGVMSWGFWAGDHWRPTGAYYDEDWTLRPHGEQFLDLVFDEWWTDETGQTASDGRYGTRAFKGDYRISAEKGDLSGETTATVDDDTDTVVVELTPPGKN